jgi:transcriptional regulator with XRE-family HTH domain
MEKCAKMHFELIIKTFAMQLEELISSLKSRRQSLAVTQEQLAELSGVALRTIKEIETGNGNPTFATLSRIADVLGLEIKLEVKQIVN